MKIYKNIILVIIGLAVLVGGFVFVNNLPDKDAKIDSPDKNQTEYIDVFKVDSKNIKTLVYTSLGYVTGSGMGKNYKSEYKLSINLWEYDTVKGEKTDKLIAEKVTNIPKSDSTNNPDTISNGCLMKPFGGVIHKKRVLVNKAITSDILKSCSSYCFVC